MRCVCVRAYVGGQFLVLDFVAINPLAPETALALTSGQSVPGSYQTSTFLFAKQKRSYNPGCSPSLRTAQPPVVIWPAHWVHYPDVDPPKHLHTPVGAPQSPWYSTDRNLTFKM